MKLMSSGVTSSAAMVRSPSFSRSSSSQTMTILPALISSTTSSMGLNGIFDAPLGLWHLADQTRLQQPLHVLSYDVRFQVHAIARAQLPQVRVRAGLREDRDREGRIQHRDHGEAYPVHADAPLLDGVAEHALGRLELPDLGVALRIDTNDSPHPVHVALHDVPPEPPSRAHRALQVDGAPLDEAAQRRAPKQIGRASCRERV